jgi:predicted metal-binding membrane protein
MTLSLGALLSRPQRITLAALVILVILAWAWLLAGAGMELTPDRARAGQGAMSAMPPHVTSVTAWPAHRLALTCAMWWVMMVAMMLPSAAPVILLYIRASGAAHDVTPASGSLLGGYLAIWAVFAVAASGLQILLEQKGLVSPMSMRSERTWLTAALLLAAGIYQLSPAKAACLRQCRNPAQSISRCFRQGSLGAWRMGAIHGGHCVGCCWSLMLLLFAGGVMNLAWIAALTLLVAAEKLLPFGGRIPVVSGIALIAGAVALIVATR